MINLDSVRKWAYGFNWQIVLLKLGIAASIAAALVVWGVSIGKEECADQKIKEAATQVHNMKEFVPTIAAQERARAEQEVRLERMKEDYNEQVDKANRSDSCDLSPDELRAFQELVEG